MAIAHFDNLPTIFAAWLLTVIITPLLSLWEIKNENQIFNCRYITDLSIYFLTEWLKSRFLVKVLCYNHPRLFSAESDKRGLMLSKKIFLINAIAPNSPAY